MKNLIKIKKIQKAFSHKELIILQDLISKERTKLMYNDDLSSEGEIEFSIINDLNNKLKNSIKN